jgi:hypothetical protein
MDLITSKDDPRLDVRVYRNAPDGLVRALEDIQVLAASLKEMIGRHKFVTDQWNSALSELSGIRERMTREKVAEALFRSDDRYRKQEWVYTHKETKEAFYKDARAVLALLEGRKG